MVVTENESAMRWFLARSDVEATMRYLDRYNVPDVLLFRNYAEQYWPSYFTEKGYHTVYEVAGRIEARVTAESVIQLLPQQWRFQLVGQILRALGLKADDTILDFGCSRGIHALMFHNSGVAARWHCVDIDVTSILEAQRLCGLKANDPSSFRFSVDDQIRAYRPCYRVAVLMEVLEHVKDPVALLDKVEGVVVPGGWVVITVPSGPMEYPMWVEHPERLREHIREFTLEDLLDILGGRAGLEIYFRTFGMRVTGGVPMMEGCYVLYYQVKPDRSPLGGINWDRKLTVGGARFVELPGL